MNARQRFGRVRLALIVIAISAIAVLLPVIAAPEQNADDNTGQILQLLLSGKGSSLIQKPIVLSGIAVQGNSKEKNTAPNHVTTKHPPAFWVGKNAQEAVLVTVPSGLMPVNRGNTTAQVKKGDLVDITGTVRPAPDAIQLKAVYHLGASEVQRVQREGVVVEAGSIVVRGKRSG
jgi:hypothetical protein